MAQSRRMIDASRRANVSTTQVFIARVCNRRECRTQRGVRKFCANYTQASCSARVLESERPRARRKTSDPATMTAHPRVSTHISIADLTVRVTARVWRTALAGRRGAYTARAPRCRKSACAALFHQPTQRALSTIPCLPHVRCQGTTVHSTTRLPLPAKQPRAGEVCRPWLL